MIHKVDKNYVSNVSDHEYDEKIENKEYNLSYKLSKNMSAYIGYMDYDENCKYNQGTGYGTTVMNKNIFQVGAEYHANIGPNMIGWIGTGFGKDMKHYECGIEYDFDKNVGAEIAYKYTDVKDLENGEAGWSGESKTKGLYAD